MRQKVKNLILYFLCAAALLLLCCLIQVGAGFTSSGIISFYGIEIIGLCVAVYILIYIIRKWRSISRENKIILLLTLIFTVYCAADYAMRILTKGLELKSILVIESNLFVIGFMFIILFKIVPVKKAITLICCFSCVLGILSAVLYFFIDYNISNVILLNHATRTFLLGALLPFTVYSYVTMRDRFSAVCFYVHLSTLIFCGLVSGARLNYVLIPLLAIISLIILVRNKLFSWIKVIASILVPIIFIFISANFYLYIYTQLTRLPVTNVVLQALNITYHGQTGSTIDGDLSEMIDKLNSDNLTEQEKNKLLEQIAIKSAELSTGESTSIRFYAWEQSVKDIKKDPLFGIGLQQYSATSSDGQLTVPIQPHNFILEYALSFGIIGFLLWAVMFLSPLFLAYKTIRFRIWKSDAALCCASTIIFVFAGAFFEPYFLFPSIMAFIYAVIGCYCLLIKQGSVVLLENTKAFKAS